ncbi:hypothetical protein OG754_19210 [Streptomyces decoyicus]|uniref:hypothetical protein n=1 Tax=Streptomyces decoyicus TaxID=249567 RepID=UPI002E347A0B|nr:hypothetical protein [Streptomyces decoyicus]
MTSNSRRTVEKGAVDTIAAAIATGAGIAIGGPFGGVVGAFSAPALSSAAGMLVEHVRQRRLHRSGQVLRNVARTLGMSESSVVDRLISDDGILELASRVILAAQDISLDQKRRALARALAAAIADGRPATLDISGLIARAITGIDAPHIRMMAILEDAAPLPSQPNDAIKYGMQLTEIIQKDPGLTEGAYPILRQLLYLGVAEDATNGMTFLESSRAYALSELGRKVLETLRDGPNAGS